MITFLAAFKIAILDIDTTIAKKSIEKKKYFQVVNILKESMKTTTISKHIIDLKVSFIVCKLRASILVVEK